MINLTLIKYSIIDFALQGKEGNFLVRLSTSKGNKYSLSVL